MLGKTAHRRLDVSGRPADECPEDCDIREGRLPLIPRRRLAVVATARTLYPPTSDL